MSDVAVIQPTVTVVTVIDQPTAQVVTVVEEGRPGTGIPAGGTTGQVATKASSDDFDIVWASGTGEPVGLSDTTRAAITAQIAAAVSALVNGAPGTLDTLKELADALGDNANFAATMATALAAKQNAANAVTATVDGSGAVTLYMNGTVL